MDTLANSFFDVVQKENVNINFDDKADNKVDDKVDGKTDDKVDVKKIATKERKLTDFEIKKKLEIEREKMVIQILRGF